MKINVALDVENKKQAQELRKAWYPPDTTASQIRDSFLFNECIDRFTGDNAALAPYLDTDPLLGTSQRLLTIKEGSHKRLTDIASALNTSLAASYRAIIKYSLDKIKKGADTVRNTDTQTAEIDPLLETKISLLAAQIEACNKTMAEIKKMLWQKEETND